MASNLRVDTILPSTGTSLGIGTASGTINFLGDSQINTTGVITASNFKTGSTNVHSGGLSLGAGSTVGAVTGVTTYYGDGSQLSGISVDTTKIETGNTKVETIDTGSDGHVKFTTEGTERLRITSAGKVITTISSPDPYNTVNTNLELVNGAGNQGAGSRIDFTVGNGKAHIQSQVTGGNSNSGAALVFATSPDAAGADERFRIETNGDTQFTGQKHTFRFDNSGGIGPYLSLQNRVTATGTACGIAFGCGNSDASMTTSDYAEAQLKVYTDSGLYGNMEFNLHTGANRSYMKIVGNGQGYTGAGAGTEGQIGGVAFGNAGIAIDRSWTGQPGIHVFNQNVVGDTDQGTFRFHGWNTSYASYPGRSGSDFGVNVTGDGSGFSSDERKKTGITTITNALNTVAQLRGVSYKFVNSELNPQTHMTMDNGTKLGFVAQEVIPLLPSIVIDAGGEKAVPHENGWCDRYCIDYGSVTALLTEAIKELKSKNESLEARIAALEGS